MHSPGRWRTGHFSLLLALGLVFAGCAGTKHVYPPEEFYGQPRTERVGILLHDAPGALMAKEGAQGLLDIAISAAATSDLTDHLETLSTQGAMAQLTETQLSPAIGRLFPSVRVLDKTVQQFCVPENDGGNDEETSRLDVRGLAAGQEVDYVLILKPHLLGLTRSYYGFIALGSPSGQATIQGTLVDGKTNRVIWNYVATGTTEIAGEWEDPPGFPSLTRAIAQAIGMAVGELGSDLTRNPPEPQDVDGTLAALRNSGP